MCSLICIKEDQENCAALKIFSGRRSIWKWNSLAMAGIGGQDLLSGGERDQPGSHCRNRHHASGQQALTIGTQAFDIQNRNLLALNTDQTGYAEIVQDTGKCLRRDVQARSNNHLACREVEAQHILF